ncbi:hypothetical protein GCM10022225_69920 [Plantactinospora mayteni]|uniref:Uncharacterized protein n=1 Tax=Plantactinospora mayteni TaxID=566021 RepID=A0ABQ4EW24_9ACTN|nr:hypothetical protein [Plantactinospora mayteni]GIG98851.1 hypothetical protein Pma05_54240 [Plantactinospora mayteni]
MRIRTGLLLGLLLLGGVAGCGGADQDPEIATAGGPAASASGSAGPAPVDEAERARRFGQCMRDNGVPDFPDPEIEGGAIRMRAPEGADRAKMEAAQQKCKEYLPNGGEPPKLDPQAQQKMREYARCMRENGVPRFPDPGADGGIRIEGGSDLDPQSESFKAAEQACAGHRPEPSGGAEGGQRTDSQG